MGIRAVFWDIDGTMVTSEPLHDAKSWHFGRTYNLPLTEQIVSGFQGVGDHRVYEIMQGLGYQGSLEEYFRICDEYYFANIDRVDIREGFLDAFAHFEGLGIYQSAVSNATAPLVEANIGRTGIGEKLVVRVDLDYVVAKGLNAKPAPDPYLEGLRLLNEATGANIEPEECLVIEDSPTGAAAGMAAGMTTIFWKLAPDVADIDVTHTAYSADELMAIVRQLTPKRAA